MLASRAVKERKTTSTDQPHSDNMDGGRRYALVVFEDRPAGLLPHADESGLFPEARPNLTALSWEEIRLLQSAFLSGHRQARCLQVPGARSAPWPRSLGLAPKKDALRPTLQLSCARTRRNPRRWNAAYLPRAHPPRLIQSQTALELLASDRYLQKGIGLIALPDAGLPKSSSAPPSASLETPLSRPPLRRPTGKLGQVPGTSFEPYLIPVLGDPKKIVQALQTLRSLKSFPSIDQWIHRAVHGIAEEASRRFF